MKTLEEIIKQNPVYLHDWSDKIDVIYDFEDFQWRTKENQEKVVKNYDGINILFASYSYENYSGDAYVLFEKNGKLFEVFGSHCSCYGLEGQFEPDEVSLEELNMRLLNGEFGVDNYSENEFAEELKEFLGVQQ
ncbi:hypothetical protein [Flavobacterium filum]|uniref:hypothetical protein n=1 Tax=Flavobacterium filum TaxID=370974 RepID=UPI0023F3FE89|nr:hypothetical protein [Flavobacterium filum]